MQHSLSSLTGCIPREVRCCACHAYKCVLTVGVLILCCCVTLLCVCVCPLVCDECAWSLSRHTAKENAWPLCHLACVVLCWSQCCPTACARWFVTTSDAVSGLRQAASPFGPLWGHFSLDFLLPGKEGGGDASSTAGDTSTGL